MPTVDLRDARWRKSSRSNSGGNGNCVEVARVEARWRKSSRSNGGGNGACVEVAFTGPGAAVRDSKNPGGRALVLGPGAWAGLLAATATR